MNVTGRCYIGGPSAIGAVASLAAHVTGGVRSAMADPTLPLRAGTLDLARRVLTRVEGGERVLTTKETELVAYLAARATRPVSRDELLREVWGYRAPVETRTLDVTVRRVRSKIEVDPSAPDHLLTQHGEGYLFRPLATPRPAAPAPSTEEVTLVFTDIEGSTARWERFGAAFHPVLQQHDRVVRAAVAAHRGYEVKTVGDAFVVAFGTATDALRFCLDAQARLRAEDWGPFGPVRVRMGAHVGRAIERADHVTGRRDWFGPVVNRAARVAGMANGGQIVVTEQARASALAEATWTDLGAHPVEGVGEPLQVWQADPVGAVPARFPPLRSRALAALPLPVDRFFGRVSELAELEARRRGGARLVTVVGPGGTGKSRIALEVARRWPPGRALFVELAEVPDAAGFRATLARALAQPAAGESIEQLGRVLADRDTLLLILDNAEHLTTIAGEAASRWLRQASALLILVTSRAPLRVPGEQRLDLGPLGAEDAASLFVERAKARVPSFSADPAEVAALVQELDGWPLSIEIAASRVATFPVPVLRKRLRERFRLLAGGVGPERQRSLQTVLDDAWDALGPDARAALSQLGLYVGGFAVGEIDAVLELPGAGDVWVALEELVDRALVRVDESTGRGDLPATIREYAVPRLDPESLRRTEERHARWLLDLPDTCARLGPELDNLLAATRRASARGDLAASAALALRVARVAELQGPYGATADLCEAVAAALPPGPDAARLRLAAAELSRNAGDPARTFRMAEALADDPHVGLRARASLAAALYDLHRRAEAVTLASRVEPEARAAGADAALAWALTVQAVLAAKSGRADGEALLSEAMEVADRAGEVECSVITRVTRLRSALLAGDLAGATRWLDAARAEAGRHGHRRAEELVEVWAGLALLEQGQADAALPHLHRALQGCVAAGRLTFRSKYAANLGLAHLMEGRVAEGEQHLRDALRWGEPPGSGELGGHALRLADPRPEPAAGPDRVRRRALLALVHLALHEHAAAVREAAAGERIRAELGLHVDSEAARLLAHARRLVQGPVTAPG